jgi:ABC-2 type transport system permease protein
VIARIARKEATEILRDGRLRLAAAVVFTLLLAALAIGWAHWRRVRIERDAAARADASVWLDQGKRNPHSAAHFGQYAFKPVASLAFADRGIDPYMGIAIWMEAHYQNPFLLRPAEDATALQKFGDLTASTVLQLLVPLLIVLFAFSAMTSEKEGGMLAQLLAAGVSPRALAVGKALGVALALSLLIVPAAVIGAAAAVLASPRASWPDLAARIAGLSAAYLLYFLLFVGLSIAVSAWASSGRTALLILFGFWIANGLALPRVAADLAQRLHPAPTSTAFWDAVRKDMAEGMDGHNPSDARSKAFEKSVLRRYGVEKLEDLPVNFDGLALQEGEEYGNQVFDRRWGELWENFARQARVQSVLSLLAPAIAVRDVSMAFAGTDFAHHRDFAMAAERHRRVINRMLNEDMAEKAGREGFSYLAEPALWRRIPQFAYRGPTAGFALAAQRGAIALLAGWCLAAAALAAWSVSRMRVAGGRK